MIGVFDSGYGGLSVLKVLHDRMPSQRFIYLGDHRNAPYGPRSLDDVYDLTTANIDWFFRQGCRLVVLGCNTASSVLRKIQHEWLPETYPQNRVLGIIVPTVEMITGVSWSGHDVVRADEMNVVVGVFATAATVNSHAYLYEIQKRAPKIRVLEQACPALVPLIEAGASDEDIMPAIQKYVEELKTKLDGKLPDYILLGCTHYALIDGLFRAALTPNARILDQAGGVAESLADYLTRHPEYRDEAKDGFPLLFTTGDQDRVNRNGSRFLFSNLCFKSVNIEPVKTAQRA